MIKLELVSYPARGRSKKGEIKVDTRNGRIYTPEQQKQMAELLRRGGGIEAMSKLQAKFDNLMEMTIEPTSLQMAGKPPKVGRNESCPCGSGKKFKKCCLK